MFSGLATGTMITGLVIIAIAVIVGLIIKSKM